MVPTTRPFEPPATATGPSSAASRAPQKDAREDEHGREEAGHFPRHRGEAEAPHNRARRARQRQIAEDGREAAEDDRPTRLADRPERGPGPVTEGALHHVDRVVGPHAERDGESDEVQHGCTWGDTSEGDDATTLVPGGAPLPATKQLGEIGGQLGQRHGRIS